MDQQRSAILEHIIKKLSVIVPTDVSSHWSIIWSMTVPSAGCLTNRQYDHSDVASTHQHLAHNFNKPTPYHSW